MKQKIKIDKRVTKEILSFNFIKNEIISKKLIPKAKKTTKLK